MTLLEKTNKAIREAETGNYSITDKKSKTNYKYGENAFMDMQIANCLFVDMFERDVDDRTDYFGFNRNEYELISK